MTTLGKLSRSRSYAPRAPHALSFLERSLVVSLVLASLPFVSACHPSKQYQANVEITRVVPVRKDETGTPITMDLEFSFVECPGTQIEVIRGGKDFSSCITKLKAGDKAKVKLEQHWDPEGFYDYDVYEVEGCARPPDPNDEASYKMIRECNDWNVNGARVGFQCNYLGKKELTKKCPWFKRH